MEGNKPYGALADQFVEKQNLKTRNFSHLIKTNEEKERPSEAWSFSHRKGKELFPLHEHIFFDKRKSKELRFFDFFPTVLSNKIQQKKFCMFNAIFIRNLYFEKKSDNSINGLLVACLLAKMPFSWLSSINENYITFKHKNQNVINIIVDNYSNILRYPHIINNNKNFYYIHSKPLPEIKNIYQKNIIDALQVVDNKIRTSLTESPVIKNEKRSLAFYPILLLNVTNKSNTVSCFISQFFNNESLVFWFLFCGKLTNLNKSYMFNTYFDKKEDLVFLQNTIKKNCNIQTSIKHHTTVTRTYYYLHISKESKVDFEHLIKLYYSLDKIIVPTSVIYLPGSKEYSILIGLLMGDGNIRLGTGINGLARYSHTSKHLEVIKALSEEWLPLYFTKNGKNTPWPRKNPTQWWRSSKMLTELYDIYFLWYKKDGKKTIKVIPFDILEHYFTDISLAFWFMDDGYYDNKDKTFYFCTDNFTHTECLFLVDLLKKKFNIKASVTTRRKDKMWRIRLSRYSVPLFRELVTPYLIPVFYYKLGKNT